MACSLGETHHIHSQSIIRNQSNQCALFHFSNWTMEEKKSAIILQNSKTNSSFREKKVWFFSKGHMGYLIKQEGFNRSAFFSVVVGFFCFLSLLENEKNTLSMLFYGIPTEKLL